MDISKVKKVAIYPSIGFARVGNSQNGYFIGPTIPGVPATDTSDFRDKAGRIKRQAAQFFVYGLDAKGNILGELNASNGTNVDWTVEVANKKPGWYNFDLALDTPTAFGEYDMDGNKLDPKGQPLLSQKRNQSFKGEDRKHLMMTPKPQSIAGKNKNKNGKTHQFESTVGMGKNQLKVNLGELRTDGQGRLLFLGGYGKSASFDPNNRKLTTFGNNQGWHDDVSDGPVDAKVTLSDGRKLDATGAWVATAPPNFAVGIDAFTTGYDLVKDVAQGGKPEGIPGFYKDIYPVLKSLTTNQWVNAGLVRDFGWGSPYNFEDPDFIKRLNNKSAKARPLRQTVFENFRNPDYKEMEPQAWPPLYGDAVTFNINSPDPRNWYAVTRLQYANLKRWAQGRFVVDTPPAILSWEEMSPEQQANGLTEAALGDTLGGPFHPGCEFTWPMRHRMMYEEKDAFRIKRRKNAKEDWGVAISADIVAAKGGPLDGSSPGDITKWMAVPWQSDTSSCLSAYRSFAGEYLPTFWPARVPNDVLTQEDFATLEDPKARTEAKIKAYNPAGRKKWLRGFIFNNKGQFIAGTSMDDRLKGVTHFTHKWYEIGIIQKKPLDSDPKLFPSEVWVETGRSVKEKSELMQSAGVSAVPPRTEWVNMHLPDTKIT